MPRRRPRELRPAQLRVPMLAPQPDLPRPGQPLADSLSLSDHCVHRYRARAGRTTEMRPGRVRTELARIIAARGVGVERPPAWFFGGRGATVFYVTIDGRWVMPVQHARSLDGIVPAQPYVATTFISQDIVDADL